ncbi:hypothetical protein Scep_002944 [Stephania cephalantha]|uniref:Protein kinase domain-containing protein n=1 Tax=Stephania cephalantha TaxID=152367 RepID=A0AAP0Q5G7_9MAGN
MGCICSKGARRRHSSPAHHEYGESQREREQSRSSKPLVAAPSRREAIAVEASGGGNGGDGKSVGMSTNGGISQLNSQENLVGLVVEGEKKKKLMVSGTVDGRPTRAQHHRRATVDIGSNGGEPPLSRIQSVPQGVEGEQAAAGWPNWLISVAAEAIQGWVPRRADSFEKLDKVGQGTYSSVYKARDLETGKIVALKKVRFVNMDPESVRFMAREIHILRRLDHPNVIKLEGLVTSRMSGSLYLVFEYMEHDLAGLAAQPSVRFTEPQIKCYMRQLLRGLEHCHSRGVLHRDIKGSNLLIDNNGILRIGDFGLATFYNPGQKQQLTSRVVTLWYRPPELLLGATEYGVSVDLWSSGCILAELYAGKPIMPGRTEVEQLHKIFKLCGSPPESYWKKAKLPHTTIFKPQHPYKRCLADTFKDFPSTALSLLDVLLAIAPEDRGSATSALTSDFFTTKPYPCEPSNLPKYPPSKEFDAKLRDEESRRQKASAMQGRGSESGRRGNMGVPNRQEQSNLKRNVQEKGGSRFSIDPPKGAPREFGSSWNKKTVEDNISAGAHGSSRNPRDLRTQRSYMPQGMYTASSNLSGSVGPRHCVQFDSPKERSTQSHRPAQRAGSRYELDPAPEKQEWTNNMLERPASSHKKAEKVYVPKKNRIHLSGPLVPPGGNLEEMLKEHERQIQHAVRKARLDKVRTKNDFDDNAQNQSLLQFAKHAR